MLVQFSIIPIGKDVSMSRKVARVLEIIDASGLPYKVNPMGTVVEGSWRDVMKLIRQCHATVLKNEERVLTTITIDDRKGKTDRIEYKISSVERKLGKRLKK